MKETLIIPPGLLMDLIQLQKEKQGSEKNNGE